MDTALYVRIWLAMSADLNRAQQRGVIAARLVIDGHCATRQEAHRYVRVCCA